MNRKNWENQDHPQERWMAKLGEEFGEVAREVAKLCDPSRGAGSRRNAQRNLPYELEHVEFIARCWREQIERESYAEYAATVNDANA